MRSRRDHSVRYLGCPDFNFDADFGWKLRVAGSSYVATKVGAWLVVIGTDRGNRTDVNGPKSWFEVKTVLQWLHVNARCSKKR
jgi:hypothetical protein